MDVPASWEREYHGRHGTEFYHARRNLTVSVLPRYDSPRGRASERDPAGYVVRVRQLLSADPTRSLTLGEREDYGDALDLAREYMTRVDATTVRGRPAVAAFAALGAYDDAVLRALVRTATGSTVRTLVHVDDDVLDVVHGDEPAVDPDLRARIDALRDVTEPGDDAIYVARDEGALAWLPRDDGSTDGTLVALADGDHHADETLNRLAAYVRTRPTDG